MDLDMSSITKWCIGRHFALTYLIVSRLVYIELYRSVSANYFVTKTVTHRRFET
jgi:hypothetical protein